jgi:hypothetical protein
MLDHSSTRPDRHGHNPRRSTIPDEPFLREKARDAIRTGKLPVRSPDRTLGGSGCGEVCAMCGETLRRDQMELEAEFKLDDEVLGLDKYHLHPRCFTAWEFERTQGGAHG